MDRSGVSDWRILFISVGSAIRAGATVGAISSLVGVIATLISEAEPISQIDWIQLLIFPYFGVMGVLVGGLIGFIVGLAFALIPLTYWPKTSIGLRRSCIFVSALLGISYPATWLYYWIANGASDWIELLEIGGTFIGLLLAGMYAGHIGFITFKNRLDVHVGLTG